MTCSSPASSAGKRLPPSPHRFPHRPGCCAVQRSPSGGSLPARSPCVVTCRNRTCTSWRRRRSPISRSLMPSPRLAAVAVMAVMPSRTSPMINLVRFEQPWVQLVEGWPRSGQRCLLWWLSRIIESAKIWVEDLAGSHSGLVGQPDRQQRHRPDRVELGAVLMTQRLAAAIRGHRTGPLAVTGIAASPTSDMHPHCRRRPTYPPRHPIAEPTGPARRADSPSTHAGDVYAITGSRRRGLWRTIRDAQWCMRVGCRARAAVPRVARARRPHPPSATFAGPRVWRRLGGHGPTRGWTGLEAGTQRGNVSHRLPPRGERDG